MPSLARLVEKQLQKMQSSVEEKVGKEHVQVQPRIASAGKKGPRPSMDWVDKENVDPEPPALEARGDEPSRPMESITVLYDSKDSNVDNNAAVKSPQFTLAPESSLDMNVSESQSLFALDDESYSWKQGIEGRRRTWL